MSEKTVIVSDDCIHCQHVKEKIREKNLPYKIVNYKSEEGKKIVRDLNITAVPECVIVDGEKVRRCTDDEFEDCW